MRHYKCVGCRTRLRTAGAPPDLVGDLCPECGSLLEPVGELAEVLGFRSIKGRASAPDVDARDTHEQIAERLDDFLARGEARLAQAHLDAGPWVDDGGRFGAQAASLPFPGTRP